MRISLAFKRCQLNGTQKCCTLFTMRKYIFVFFSHGGLTAIYMQFHRKKMDKPYDTCATFSLYVVKCHVNKYITDTCIRIHKMIYRTLQLYSIVCVLCVQAQYVLTVIRSCYVICPPDLLTAVALYSEQNERSNLNFC